MGHNCEWGGIVSIKKEKDGVVREPGFPIEQEVVEEGRTCELKHKRCDFLLTEQSTSLDSSWF